MSEARFLDTNVLLYLISANTTKAAQVEALLVNAPGVISIQVLNEFANVAVRKFGAPWPRVREALDILIATLDVMPVTLETHRLGVQLSERYRLSLYDSLLLAAAILAGCTVFLTEDLQDGQLIEGQLTVRNPFIA
jgi:predicted nucleic acid-binding protein